MLKDKEVGADSDNFLIQNYLPNKAPAISRYLHKYHQSTL